MHCFGTVLLWLYQFSSQNLISCSTTATAVEREVRHWGRDKMAAILHTAFSNAFPEMKLSDKKSEVCSRGPIGYDSSTAKVMAWRRTGDKPLSETMMAQFIDAYMCHSASWSFNQKSLFWRNGETNIFSWHLWCASKLCDAKWSYFQWKRQANGFIRNNLCNAWLLWAFA